MLLKATGFLPWVLVIVSCLPLTWAVENFSGKSLRAVGTGALPYLDMVSSTNGQRKGVDMDVLHIIAEKLNMTLDFKPTRAWGRNINGTWTGNIGQVMRREADVGVGHMSITYDRMKVITFSEYVYGLDFVLYRARPQPLPPYFNLMKPFALELWLFFIVTPFILSLLLIPFLPKSSKNALDILGNLFFILNELVATLLGQSRPLTQLLNKNSMIFVLFWLNFTNLMLMAYECNLRAYLISMDYEDEMNTIEDVYMKDKSMFLPSGSFFFMVLRTSPNIYYRKMHDRIVENKWVYELRSDIPTWLEDEIAYKGATSMGMKQTWITRERSMKKKFGSILLRYGDYNILYYPSGFALAKKSPLLPPVNDILMHLRDNGIIEKLMKKNADNREYKDVVNTDHEAKLGIGHLLAGILIYAFLMPLATIIFVLEITCNPKKK